MSLLELVSGLKALTYVVQQDPKLALQHQMTIIECLDHPDLIIKREVRPVTSLSGNNYYLPGSGGVFRVSLCLLHACRRWSCSFGSQTPRMSQSLWRRCWSSFAPAETTTPPPTWWGRWQSWQKNILLCLGLFSLMVLRIKALLHH